VSYSTNPGVYLALDFETTGLDVECAILEVAFCVLDADFEPTTPVSSSLVLPHEEHVCEPDALAIHSRSGLADDVEKAALGRAPFVTYEQLDLALRTAVQACPDKPVLLGNNPSFDRRFIERYLPQTFERLHHRNFDVSTLRYAAASAAALQPGALKRLMGFGGHRAAKDVADCVAECQLYVNGLRATLRSVKTSTPLLAKLQGFLHGV
jgi:oligoribonuclease (3'-5' exoribonuclease)